MTRYCIACQKDNIKKYATFGYELKKPTFCKKHKTNDSFNVINKRCSKCPFNKPTIPTYGYEWRKPLYCKPHAPDDAKNVVHKRCEHDNCNKLATYGTEWMKPLYCQTHKSFEMVDVLNKRCRGLKCKKRPTYGYTSPLYCYEHCSKDMMDVLNPKCQHNQCNTRPTYGYTLHKALYCKLHKLADMIDVLNKRCKESNCNTIPCMGLDKVEYCAKHAPNGYRNLISKRCLTEHCDKLAIYGTDKNKPLYCKLHKKGNNFLTNTTYCQSMQCKTLASFGYDKHKPLNCKVHKLNDMVDVVHKKCTVCWETQTSNKKYEGMCFFCYCKTYPNRKIIRQYRSKQLYIHKYLLEHFKDIKHRIRCDKAIDGGCSKKEPDWLIECYAHTIVVECDEHQHRHISADCEQIRLNNLFIDLNERPLVVLRFNPDKYINDEGVKIGSLFEFTQKGRIKITDNSEWNTRFNALISNIEYYMKNIPEKGFTIKYLFYDS